MPPTGTIYRHSRRRFVKDIGVPFACSVGPLSSAPSSPLQANGTSDTFPATPWQGWAVSISATGGKGAFSTSDRCGYSGKKHRPGVYVSQSEDRLCEPDSRHLAEAGLERLPARPFSRTGKHAARSVKEGVWQCPILE